MRVVHSMWITDLDDVANLNNYFKRLFIIIYADDILSNAVTVSALESLLRACESELPYIFWT